MKKLFLFSFFLLAALFGLPEEKLEPLDVGQVEMISEASNEGPAEFFFDSALYVSEFEEERTKPPISG